MIVSTLSTYPGKKVVKDLGIVFAYDIRDTMKPMLMVTAVILEDDEESK